MKTKKYDILARVLLYPSDAGGLKNPITARFWGCPMWLRSEIRRKLSMGTAGN